MCTNSYHLADYHYELPPECIAQFPAPEREGSRLMVLGPKEAEPCHHLRFGEIVSYLRPGDLLVLNTTRVFPARLLGHRATGGKVELFLLAFPTVLSAQTLQGSANPASWQEALAPALIKSSKRPKPGETLLFSPRLEAAVLSYGEDGKAQVLLRFPPDQSLEHLLAEQGLIPLPPYINRPNSSATGNLPEDVQRYQTRYARHLGSVAAPTAGLHFSDALLAEIAAKGVHSAEIILHVGYGTFAPVRCEDIRQHAIHEEMVEIPAASAEKINQCKQAGGRIWAVGTTTVRTLECSVQDGLVQPFVGRCGLYIYPGFRFQVVDNLITNFHLPKSSLLFLVSALAGRKRILSAYAQAVARGYRFFSYGDAMAIINHP